MKQHHLLKDLDPRFQMLGWRVGIFAAVIGVIIVALLLTLAERQGFFNAKARLHFVAESGAGLAPGMQIRLSGFRIGVVDEVSLNEQAKVDVEILVEERYMKWVKTDSIAILQQDGLIGDHFIEISGGTAAAKKMEEGGVLSFVATMSLADIALDMRSRAEPIFESVQETLRYANDPQGDLRQTLKNVQQLSAELQQTRQKVDLLLMRADGLIDREARQTLTSADRLLNRADVIASEVGRQLPPIMNVAASSLQNVHVISKDASATMHVLRAAVEQAAPQIPGMVRNGDELIRRSNETVEAVQQIWPLSRQADRAPLLAPNVESR